MRYLIINTGSSSVKYSLYENNKLSLSKSFSRKENGLLANEKRFIEEIDPDFYILRVVHALDSFEPCFFDTAILSKIKKASSFAPLHNAFLLEILDFLSYVTTKERIILIFDTEFHKDLPQVAQIYPIDLEFAKKHNIRKYGFHGIALYSILEKLEENLGYLPNNVLALHVGGGVSLTAIKNGKSIETSMGVTPTDGLMMLTRSGSIDVELPRIMQEKENLLPSELSFKLNFESGFYGLTRSKDTKYIIEKAKEGKEPYKSAYDKFLYEAQKMIFAYASLLGPVDILTLSGGMGYNNKYLADDLYRRISHLPITREQIIKIAVDENKVMLSKAKRLLESTLLKPKM